MGKTRIINIATELFKSRLAVAEMKTKCFSDYKTKDGPGAVCFIAARYMLKAMFDNIAFDHHI